jgi:hypothetical protein
MPVAKGKYEQWLTHEGLLRLESWARDGLTNEQIAHNIGINTKTLWDWCVKYDPICNALKRGKDVVDIQVENALLKRALGYTYVETTKERIIDTGQKKRHGGEQELTEKEWELSVKYFGNRCCYCGNHMDKPTKDHIIPLISGGKLSVDNVIPCCRSCNSSKKDNEMLSWYQGQPFYNKARLQKIYDYLDFASGVASILDDFSGELITTKEVTKEVQPDTTAQIFWLKNRRPDRWRDKRDVSVDGEINTNNPFQGLTTDELRKLIESEE